MISIRLFVLITCATLIPWAQARATSIIIGGTSDLPALTGQAQQDTEANVNWLVNNWLTNHSETDTRLSADLTLSGSWKPAGWGFWGLAGTWEENRNPGFTVFSATPSRGLWFAPELWNPETPIYFSLKAGSGPSGGGFQLYYYNTPSFDSFTGRLAEVWDTERLRGKDLSHIRFWTASPTPTPSNPVPEPATAVLVGLSLLAIAGIGRKQLQR